MKKLLSVLLVLSVFAVNAQVPSYVPTNGLVAYYPFNGNANDASGNGNNGVVNGATLTSDRTGNTNNAYSFACNSIHANINTTSITNQMTLSFWYLRTAQGCIGPRVLEFSQGSNMPGNLIIEENYPTGLKIGHVTSAGLTNLLGWMQFNTLVNQTWSHYIYTNDGSIAKLYQNGILVNQYNSPGLPVLNGDVAFGWMNHPANDGVNGKLDDIAIYNRALSQSEITSLYNSNSCIANITNNDTSICRGQSVTLNVAGINNNSNFSLITSGDCYSALKMDSLNYFITTRTSVLKSNNINGNWSQTNWPLGIVRSNTSVVGAIEKQGNRFFVASLDNGNYFSNNLGSSYQSTGITGFGCASPAIKTLSNGDCLMSMGGFQRGIYKIQSSSNTWVSKISLNPDFSDFAVDNIGYIYSPAYSPNHPGGLYRSIDNGETWNSIWSTSYYDNPAIIDVNNDSIYAITVNGKLFKSQRVNINFSLVSNNNGIIGFPNDLFIDSDGIFYVTVGNYSDASAPSLPGFYISRNRGVTWSRYQVSGASNYYKINKINGKILVGTNTGMYEFVSNTPTYLWSTGATTPSITVSPTVTTKYYCTVSDGINTCKDSVTVTVNAITTNFITADTIKVCGTSTTISATTGLASYAWSNGANTASTTVTSSGWYKCTATNGACTAVDSVYVSLFNPKITQNDTTVCAGTALTLNANSNTSNSLSTLSQWQIVSSQNDFYTRVLKTNAGFYLCGARTNSRLYKSNDLSNFTPLASPLVSHNLSFGKDKNGVLYFGTGHEGIYRSTDNGNTWNYNVASGYGCGNLDFDFDSSNNLYTSVGGYLRGLYVSNNNGTNWQNTNSGMDFTEIHCVPLINKTFIVTGAYLAVSSNNGQTWSQITGQPFSSNTIMIKHIGNIVFLFTNTGKIYTSTDNANTWSLYSTFPVVTTPSYYLNDAILNSNGDWWIAIDQNGVFHSTNGGLSWTNENIGISGNTHYLLKDSNSILITTSTGIYKKTILSPITYLWSTSATTQSITVTPTATTSYIATVSNGINTCKDTVKITVANITSLAPTAIFGDVDVCASIGADTASVPVNYKINKIANAASYVWTVPAGVTLLSGQGDTSIMVRFSASFVSGAITVKSVSTCNISSAVKSVTVYKRVAAAPTAIQKEFTPTSIVATTNVSGLVSEVYRIKKVTYATSYNWYLNRGTNASITHINSSGENDTAVIVTFASCFVKDTLSVKSVTPCSISAAKTVIMSANTTPATVSVITTPAGDFAVCIGSSKSFTAIPNAPTTTQTAIAKYRWTVPANSIITSATTDSATITVLFNTGFTGGSISVKGISSCNVVGTIATTSVLQYLPPTPASIASSTNSYNACINSSVTYTALVGAPTTAQAPASVFRWTKPNNTTITSAATDSSSITLRFNTGYTGGVISVKGQSRCGAQSAARSQVLTHTGCALGTKTSLPITTINTSSFEVSLYPNPTTNEFKLLIKNNTVVGSNKPSKAIIKVIDLQGRMVKSFTTNTNQVTAIGNELKSGVYMVEVRLGEEVRTIRAVKF